MGEHIFERLARERNITVEEMRAIISARIEKGWNDPNMEKRAQWRKIPCEGEIPTPDECLRYVVRNCRQRDGKICCGGIRNSGYDCNTTISELC